MKQLYRVFLFAAASCLAFAAMGGHALGAGETYAPKVGQEGKDVIWVPTPQVLVDTMLNMAKVASSDYVIDLGSGDGCIVIAAARRGATALGIEYNPDLVELARRAAAESGVAARAAFEKADIFTSDFSRATVITMYLSNEINLKLRPKILNLKPGTRIVSNEFDMDDWQPDLTTASTESGASWHAAHLWIVPAKVGGTWRLDNGHISFIQEFQNVSGTLTQEKTMRLNGKLTGKTISFAAGGRKYTGTVNGNTISGTHDGGGFWKAVR